VELWRGNGSSIYAIVGHKNAGCKVSKHGRAQHHIVYTSQIVEECEERLGDDGIQQLLDAVQTHLRGGQ
jgi:hypothetical protein